MNTRIASVISVALCALLASCYPYDEGANRKKTKKSSTAAAAAEAEKKAEEQKLKEQQAAQTTSTDGSVITETTDSSIKPSDSPATSPTTSPTVKPTTAVKKPEYSYASKVPGKEGFVFSPYNNKVVDVRDIPSGTLVQDPTYPASEKKYFRVP
jgi:hypothetical protein